MKKTLTLLALVTFGVASAHAQSKSEVEKPSTRTAVKVEKASDADMQRAQSAKRIDASASQDHSTTPKTKVSQEQVEASIAKLEQHIHENEGKEGFNKEAYTKRLEYLRSMRTSNSDK